MITERQLELDIECAETLLATLEKNQDNHSKRECWECGYLRGRITVLKDWLDELKENATDSKE